MFDKVCQRIIFIEEWKSIQPLFFLILIPVKTNIKPIIINIIPIIPVCSFNEVVNTIPETAKMIPTNR